MVTRCYIKQLTGFAKKPTPPSGFETLLWVCLLLFFSDVYNIMVVQIGATCREMWNETVIGIDNFAANNLIFTVHSFQIVDQHKQRI